MFYTLNYFLANGTCEVKEKNQPNSGRDLFPLLLQRSQLPLDFRSPDGTRVAFLTSGYRF